MAATRAAVLFNSSSALSAKSDKVLFASTTSHNVAEDNAIQINGHIANEVNNYICGTLIVNYFSTSSSKRRARSVNDASPLKPVLEKFGPQLKPASHITDKPPAQMTQACPKHQPKRRHKVKSDPDGTHDITLSSSLSGKRGVVCAIKRVDCQRNYISDRIVRRYALTSHIDCSADTTTIVTGDCRITPSPSYVVLVTSGAARNKLRPHHFYIVEHCSKFDILIGSEVITDLSPSN